MKNYASTDVDGFNENDEQCALFHFMCFMSVLMYDKVNVDCIVNAVMIWH